MKRTLLFIPLVIMVALLWRVGGGLGTALAATCPNPLPSCSAGDNSILIGYFGCTVVGSYSDGTVHVSLLEMVFNGDGTGSTEYKASNVSNGSFTPWTSAGALTYCINTDTNASGQHGGTGYIFPPGVGVCPVAIVLDLVQGELRLLDTSQNRAEVGVCQFAD